MSQDLLFVGEKSSWGKFDDLNNCKQLHVTRVCNLTSSLVNLEQNELCVAEVVFHNKTTNCKSRHIEIMHDIWLPTTKRNTWKFLTPKKTALTINKGNSTQTLFVIGAGEVRLEMNTSVITKNVRLTYIDDIDTVKDVNIFRTKIRFPTLGLDSSKNQDIPKLGNISTTYSIINKKKLFDLGVDLKSIERHVIPLENPDYAPYEYPWWFSSSIILVGLVPLAFLVGCLRGKWTCCTRRYTVARDIEEIHLEPRPHMPHLIENKKLLGNNHDKNEMKKSVKSQETLDKIERIPQRKKPQTDWTRVH